MPANPIAYLIVGQTRFAFSALKAFFDAGYTDVQALEVVLGLAVKLMSNYTNSIAGTPLDKAVERLRWRKPAVEERR